jgi:hypothetical protein
MWAVHLFFGPRSEYRPRLEERFDTARAAAAARPEDNNNKQADAL